MKVNETIFWFVELQQLIFCQQNGQKLSQNSFDKTLFSSIEPVNLDTNKPQRKKTNLLDYFVRLIDKFDLNRVKKHMASTQVPSITSTKTRRFNKNEIKMERIVYASDIK